ncbi:GNAT family N-acetyltransferase [Streptosporangium longisporum]|uniref:GNAT family N-acetyltransferase n=1 Tax=Streptosporangium longisporum TaxID=46187 RepID=A0ABP6L689_9ACTN
MSRLRTLSATEILSERLLLRRTLHEADREGFVELHTDPEVQAYIGGPQPRGDVERRFDAAIAGERPPIDDGVTVVATVMKLPTSARTALSARLGPDYEVYIP